MTLLKLAVLFPGQGSQSIGMLNTWRGNRIAEETMSEASSAIDLDLWSLISNADAATLADTRNTQPAIVAVSLALFRAWQQHVPVVPVCGGGHSVGEISAMAAAGIFSLEDAMRLVRVRANAMAQAVPPGIGGMAAVLGLADANVEQLCIDCAQGEVLEPVNYNAPGQVIVAGHADAIARIARRGRDAGAKMVYVLPVSGPFHSSLMTPAAEVLSRHLASVVMGPAAFPVLTNNGRDPKTAEDQRRAIVDQISSPVYWSKKMLRMAAIGVSHYVEVGPGEVLAGLCTRIMPKAHVMPLHTPQAMEVAVKVLYASAEKII